MPAFRSLRKVKHKSDTEHPFTEENNWWKREDSKIRDAQSQGIAIHVKFTHNVFARALHFLIKDNQVKQQGQ
jgi:hypothetical protein